MASAPKLSGDVRAAPADRQAFERLLVHYSPFLQLAARHLMGSTLRRREDAADIVQRTFVEALEAIDRFHGQTEAEFFAWIKQILRHNVANAVRDNYAVKRDMRRELHADQRASASKNSWQLPAAEQTSPSLRAIKAETARNLARSLQRLPSDQRRAVSMRHLEGRALAEIAKVMRKTPPAVAGLIRRGVQSLRHDLADENA